MSRQSKIADTVGWAVLAVAILGLIGSIGIETVGGALVWVIVGGGAVWHLTAARRRRASAAAAEIAARAERENELYLDGDSSGLYGQYRPPTGGQ